MGIKKRKRKDTAKIKRKNATMGMYQAVWPAENGFHAEVVCEKNDLPNGDVSMGHKTKNSSQKINVVSQTKISAHKKTIVVPETKKISCKGDILPQR